MTHSDPPRALRDDVLVAMLAGGATREDAAAEAGVSLSTVKRRLRSSAFVARVDAARGDVLGRCLDMLGAGSLEAAVVLRAIVLDRQPEEGDGPSAAQAPGARVRVAAARTLLAAVLAHRDQLELAERVDALERRIAAQQPHHLRGVPS